MKNTYVRDIINSYYSRPEEMSMGEFCKANQIKVLTLKKLLELHGQKLMPGLTNLAKRSLAIYNRESAESLETLWRESSHLIAIEISDKEKALLGKKYGQWVEFEHIRFRLLVDVAMMPPSLDAFKVILKVHKEVLSEYPF
jgi:hypothetical protein